MYQTQAQSCGSTRPNQTMCMSEKCILGQNLTFLSLSWFSRTNELSCSLWALGFVLIGDANISMLPPFLEMLGCQCKLSNDRKPPGTLFVITEVVTSVLNSSRSYFLSNACLILTSAACFFFFPKWEAHLLCFCHLAASLV